MIGILAEKPSQMRNFEKALGGHSGTYNGEQYVLCAARGHLYEWKDPQDNVDVSLQEAYHKWSLDNLPWTYDAFKWQRRAKSDTRTTLKSIKDTLSKCDEICIGTDDDPTGEGELLAWEVLDELGFARSNKKFSRMYFVDESAKEVQKAFVNRKPIVSMLTDNDYLKAVYRSKWDYMSMQFTRIASLVSGQRCVIRQGRLKSSMVLLVGDQLKKVGEYKKIPFYQNRFKDENGVVYTNSEEPMYKTRAEVPQVYGRANVVVDSKERKTSAPQKLMDLARLSSILAAKGVKSKNVLAIVQSLYQAQILSYPRTEDKFVTPEQFDELLPKVDAIADIVGVDKSLLTHRHPRKTHVKEGCAHGANRPGPNVPKSLDELDRVYGKGAGLIYETLAKNYLAMLAEDYEYEQQKGHLQQYPDFKGSCNVALSLGWKAISTDAKDEDTDNDGKGLGTLADPFVHEGFPPKPTHPTMKWLMTQLEKYDVGTGATRVSTYNEVVSTTEKYPLLEEKKTKLYMTQYGEMSYRLLPGTHIGDIHLTERLMQNMKDVAAGKLDADSDLRQISQLVLDDIKTMSDNSIIMKKELKMTDEQNLDERVQGIWNGENVSFKRVWSGHRFTDDEVNKLLAGEVIQFRATSKKTGKDFLAAGSLAHGEWEGKPTFGFQPNFDAVRDPNRIYGTWEGKEVSFKREWSGHTFTDAEVQQLWAGNVIEITAHSNRTGNDFNVTGQLGWSEYNGRPCFGFQPNFGN